MLSLMVSEPRLQAYNGNECHEEIISAADSSQAGQLCICDMVCQAPAREIITMAKSVSICVFLSVAAPLLEPVLIASCNARALAEQPFERVYSSSYHVSVQISRAFWLHIIRYKTDFVVYSSEDVALKACSLCADKMIDAHMQENS